jgi:threo-3-hydroxy-L-aspartate ammonia-lyase
VTFPLVMRYVSDMLTVTDAELLQDMFLLWERMKIVVEPTGALAFSALMRGKAHCKGKRVGVILSGGNVDLGWAGAQLSSLRPS